ncbi:Myb-like DNA-binding domain protein [Mortierella antarctica]|nr:Myb-like DNA-binding domain protein [Mortierella antarctica]
MSVQNLDLHDHEFSSDFVNDIDSLLNDHDPDIVTTFFAPFRSVSPPYSFSEYTHQPLPTSSHRAPYDPQNDLTSLVLSDSVYPGVSPILDLHSTWSMTTRGLVPEISIQPEKLSMGAFDESTVDPLFLDQDPLNVPLGITVPLDPSSDPRPLGPTIASAPMEPFPSHPPFEHHSFVQPPPPLPQSHYPPPHYYGGWADYRHEMREPNPASQADRHRRPAPWTPYPTGPSMSISPPHRHYDYMGRDMYERPEGPWSPFDPSHHRSRSIQSHEASPSPRSSASEPTSLSKRRCPRSNCTHSSEASMPTRSKQPSVSFVQPSGTRRKRAKQASPPEDKYCNLTRWMAVEIELLMSLVRQQKDKDNIRWDQIAEDLDTERSPSQCQNRWNAEIAKNDPNKDDDDTYILKGRWSPDEDQALKQGVEEFLRKQGLTPKPPAHLPDEEEEDYPTESRVPVTREQDGTSESELFNSLVDKQLCDDSGPDVPVADQAYSKVPHHQQFSNQSSASSLLGSPYHSSPSSPSSFSTTSSTPSHRSHHTGEVSRSSVSATTIRTRQDYENQVSRVMQKCPWNLIVLQSIPGRTGIQAQARWSEALDPLVRRGKWTEREDRMLFVGAETHTRCWIRIADGIRGRTQRQCRTRWVQLRTKREREEAEAKALELIAKQQKREEACKTKEKKDNDDDDEEEEEEEETKGMKKVIRRKGRDLVLGRRFS